MEKILDKIEKYILYITLFIFPVFIFTISSNPYIVPKLELLSFALLILLLIRAIKIISSGKLEFTVGNFDLPIFLIAVSYILSTILRTSNKMEALILPGTTTAVVAGVLLYFIINQLKENDKKVLSYILYLSSAFFSAFMLLSFSGLFGKIPQLPAFIKASGFTPEGGFLPAAIFLAATTPIGLGFFFTEKDKSRKILTIVAGVVVILGLIISIYNIFPGRPLSPKFPSYGVSWGIAIDALKNSPILGVGSGNYLTAFNRFRPISYNQTDLWAIKFTTANSYYLTLFTEVGLLGLAGLILLIYNLYKTARIDLKENKIVNWGFAAIANLVSLIIIVIALAVAPATILLNVLFFILFAFNSKTRHTSLNLTTQEVHGETHGFVDQTQKAVVSRFPAFLITIPVIIVLAYAGFRAVRIGLAEYKFKVALDYLIKNDAAKTYDTMREAIALNPYVDRYHSTYSRINLAIANSIAQKQDITDQDRSTITTLIQQAIQESKSNVALNPLRAGNWETLGQVYRAIIPFAQGADAFAVQTLRQAVALDPINPNLRIQLGGIYYAQGDFENASKIFELAVSAKPDYANARYNYAFALRDSKKLDQAINEMTLVLSLIDKNSPDYETAKKALEDMQSKKKAEAPTGEQLTPPQPAQEPVITPPIELPEGSNPPESPISPTPTAAQEVTPMLTPTPTR